jgi:hypothetical protein
MKARREVRDVRLQGAGDNGVNLADLNKLMKTVDNTDTLTFF